MMLTRNALAPRSYNLVIAIGVALTAVLAIASLEPPRWSPVADAPAYTAPERSPLTITGITTSEDITWSAAAWNTGDITTLANIQPLTWAEPETADSATHGLTYERVELPERYDCARDEHGRWICVRDDPPSVPFVRVLEVTSP